MQLSSEKRGQAAKKTVIGFISLIAYLTTSAATYFSVGRTDLPIAWIYFNLNLILGLIFSIILARTDPELIAERVKPGPGEQDRVFIAASTIFVVLQVALAGLDVDRYHWTVPMSSAAQISALILVLVGYALISWSVLTNRFFSSGVRLQPDRQQIVIDKGPYAYVRHPGYAGAILYMPLGGLALGSWLAGIAAGTPLLLLILRRTLLEDVMLCNGLPGYEAYAERVKYRLAPGVW